MSLPLQPLADHIIVKPRRETETPTGIVIPDTALDSKSDRGEVLAVGPGRLQEDGTRAPMDVAVGDTVLFAKYAADEIEVDGATYLVLTQLDVKAKVSSNSPSFP